MKFMTEQPPIVAGSDLQQVVAWIARQLRNLEGSIELIDHSIYAKHHVAPTKLVDGLVMYADGTDWNPGSGAGLYLYNGSSWKLLG